MNYNARLLGSARTTFSLLQELLRRLTRRVDFEVDEHEAGVRTARTFEFPGDLVTLARELSPFRGLCRILLQPEVLILSRERAQARLTQAVGPRTHLGELNERLPLQEPKRFNARIDP